MKKKQPLSAAKDTFAGIKLFPMSKQREVVACDMGLKRGFVTTYKTQYLLRDTIIVLWLRSIPAEGDMTSEWTVTRAEFEPDEAMKAALEWADKMGIGTASKRFHEAWPIFIATFDEIRAATGEPIIPKDRQRDEPSGEL